MSSRFGEEAIHGSAATANADGVITHAVAATVPPHAIRQRGKKLTVVLDVAGVDAATLKADFTVAGATVAFEAVAREMAQKEHWWLHPSAIRR